MAESRALAWGVLTVGQTGDEDGQTAHTLVTAKGVYCALSAGAGSRHLRRLSVGAQLGQFKRNWREHCRVAAHTKGPLSQDDTQWPYHPGFMATNLQHLPPIQIRPTSWQGK